MTIVIYEMLRSVDKNCLKIRFTDPISDFLYHIKYMFVGDTVRKDIDDIIPTFSSNLKSRLKFMTHKDESSLWKK